ncbi:MULTISPECIES: c-type cytochrome [Halomonadaceae]|jgi:cytochrome c|uniref:Cytochrome c2 iso-2 n=1 Tax=Vreelandella titanicae TaxID=664683 RepID=A0AAP9NS89_9GAMM|nr:MULTISPECIES: c-type cytochrome [Halomonas]QKS27236.1 Cytochrome c2 iso-2 [Halomonas titanicae]CDG51200.1 Cytochrome c class I [Halomonas sp. A3H3]SDJ03497.1 cytochrome c [Halomonas titanicae]|tara:strand:+ start:216 stop:611 length:396 start_codon:yes stop_codon:yes gene_type:complete
MKTTNESPHLAALLLFATGILAGFFALATAVKAQETGSERLFQQRCGSCHSLQIGQNGIGPHLAGVIGRAAGSIEGARYSDAMRDSGIVWDNRSLDTFLAAPHEVVPGTRMTVTVPDDTQRAAIIDYLENQ